MRLWRSKRNTCECQTDSFTQMKPATFLKSLQFRIILIISIAGLVSSALMSVLSYLRVCHTAENFVDEELSQIASVAINYHMIIPRRWQDPRENKSGIRMMKSPEGRIVLMMNIRDIEQWVHTGKIPADLSQNHQAKNEEFMPSLTDLSELNYDIMIAPLFGRPGDPLYIPNGVSDGFYTVMVADERVRAFVATNTNGQRFVVARPLSSIDVLTKQAFASSVWQFCMIVLILIPLLIISVRLMMMTLNRIARNLYRRSEDDLSPIIPRNHGGFVPSELNCFIGSINRLFARVDENMQSKRRFIADAAHEMRTQSTVLSLQAEALDREELSPSARQKLDRLQEGIKRERELMTSLLTLAREQAGTEVNTAMLETINIFELYTQLIDDQGLLADKKNIDLGVEGETHYQLVTDRMRLMRIMSNLLSNAVKYTPENGRIDLKAEKNEDGSLTLIVQDDGPGVSEEHLKHLVEPFYRVDGDRSAIQGTGLGLAIVQASAESLKAKLLFEQVKPHGLKAAVCLSDYDASEKKSEPLVQHHGRVKGLLSLVRKERAKKAALRLMAAQDHGNKKQA